MSPQRVIAAEAIAAIVAASRTIKRQDRRWQFFGHVSFALGKAIGAEDTAAAKPAAACSLTADLEAPATPAPAGWIALLESRAADQAALDAWPTLQAEVSAGRIDRETALSAAKADAAGWPA